MGITLFNSFQSRDQIKDDDYEHEYKFDKFFLPPKELKKKNYSAEKDKNG